MKKAISRQLIFSPLGKNWSGLGLEYPRFRECLLWTENQPKQSRYFVKTAVALSDKAFLIHEERMVLLDNTYLLATEIEHQLLVDCYGKIGSIWGTALVYE